MFKRLTISLLLMGLAAFGLGAAAFAWFSDSGSGDVSVSAGNVDLQFRIDYDCDGGPQDGYDSGWEQANPTAAPFSWTNIVPGDTTQDCIEVKNESPNGEMTVYVFHSDWYGEAALRNATRWQYTVATNAAESLACPATVLTHAQYITGRGCELHTIAPGESFILRVDVSFPDTGSSQNSLKGLSFNFDVTLTGYTS